MSGWLWAHLLKDSPWSLKLDTLRHTFARHGVVPATVGVPSNVGVKQAPAIAVGVEMEK
jgi:hypothetical protein